MIPTPIIVAAIYAVQRHCERSRFLRTFFVLVRRIWRRFRLTVIATAMLKPVRLATSYYLSIVWLGSTLLYLSKVH
jgi:hypothetical protein